MLLRCPKPTSSNVFAYVPAEPDAQLQVPAILASAVLRDNTKVLAEARSLPTWQLSTGQQI